MPDEKIGYVIAIAGAPGKGKTHFTKKLIGNQKNLIFDVNNEYKESKYKRDINLDKGLFLERIKKLENTMIVFEDATGFYASGKTDEETTKLAVKRRHQSNVYIFLFHSLSDIPRQLGSYIDYLVIMDTKENEPFLKKKNPHFYELWLEYNKTKKFSHFFPIATKTPVHKPQIKKLI